MYTDARKSRRFPPDEGTMAWIDPKLREDKGEFKATIAGLVTDEALYGCGVVTLFDDRISEDAECMVRVGNLAPLKSRIRWVRDLNNDVRKIGVMFLE